MKRKSFDELTLMDDYMFAQVMRNTDFLKPLLECILGFEIAKIQFVEPQKSEKEGYDSKAIRLDLYVEDINHNIYNVEVQTTNKKNLPRRIRYYQSVIDISILAPGVNYNELKNTFVIFICNYDPFELGQYIYTFENKCKEIPGLSLGDGTSKIIVNTNGKNGDVSHELSEILKYLNDGTISGDYTKKLDETIINIKANEERRIEYMIWSIHEKELIQEATEEGFEQGMQQGMQQGIQQGMQQGMKDGIDLGEMRMLFNLTEKKIITIEQAAQEAGMTVDEFNEKMTVKL